MKIIVSSTQSIPINKYAKLSSSSTESVKKHTQTKNLTILKEEKHTFVLFRPDCDEHETQLISEKHFQEKEKRNGGFL